MPRQNAAEIAGQIDRADDRGVELACSSQAAAIASARMPDVSSHETVKLGPPIRSSRATRLATMPPKEPIVRFAESAGPAAVLSSAIHSASSSSESPSRKRLVPSPGLAGERPAKMIIRRAQVEPDADQHACRECKPIVPASVLGGLGGDLQHQGLLRQHLPELSGRDPKLIDPELEVFDEQAVDSPAGPIQSSKPSESPEFPTSPEEVSPHFPDRRTPRAERIVPARRLHRSERPFQRSQSLLPLFGCAAFALGRQTARRRPTHSSINTCGIDSAEAEAADGRAAGPAARGCRPRLGTGEDAKRALIERELGCRAFEVRGRGQDPVSECQQDLDQIRPRRRPSGRDRCSTSPSRSRIAPPASRCHPRAI